MVKFGLNLEILTNGNYLIKCLLSENTEPVSQYKHADGVRCDV